MSRDYLPYFYYNRVRACHMADVDAGLRRTYRGEMAWWSHMSEGPSFHGIYHVDHLVYAAFTYEIHVRKLPWVCDCKFSNPDRQFRSCGGQHLSPNQTESRDLHSTLTVASCVFILTCVELRACNCKWKPQDLFFFGFWFEKKLKFSPVATLRIRRDSNQPPPHANM